MAGSSRIQIKTLIRVKMRAALEMATSVVHERV